MSLLLGLDEISDADGDLVGGKAVALAALQRCGRRVPRTLCLTTEAYELFVDQAGLRPVIYQEIGRKSWADMRWEELWDAALRIRSRFLRASVPDEVVAAVEAALRDDLAQRRLAVRSSARGEDSAGASFAGLHDSFVGVLGVPATIETIRKVWASLWTDRALLYRRELGIDADTSAMAVVLQELVEGEASGIAFGAHPNDPNLMAVEAVYGLNQGLVDGTIEPDLWSLERRNGTVVEHTAPGRRHRLVAHRAGTRTEVVPPGLASLPPLDSAGLAEVFEAVTAAGHHFGSPQDVEWTFADGQLVLLQSRPVTTVTGGEGDKRAWYLGLTRSAHAISVLRERIESELLPAMDKEADEIGSTSLESLDGHGLVEEIERRRLAHDRWVETYTQDFIPLAHGVRLFGQFYDEVVHPDDPFEFMDLLVATPMLSVRRDQMLASLATRVRNDPELLSRLEAGEPGDAPFESDLAEFEREFGGAAFGSQRCFGDRTDLARLLRSLATSAQVTEPSPGPDVEARTELFLDGVGTDRRGLAEELLDLARASYRLRDDDNIHLGRLEALVLEAVEEGHRRLSAERAGDLEDVDLARITETLRHPNLVVEPKREEISPSVEPGFHAQPRQLVGQPAGPGVATGVARVITTVEDLFRFQPGEILVCDAIDPNMTFVVPMAAAVVERRGGMLIHGAIIAREYGLPCVTGVPQVTTLVGIGDRLTVDGFLGIVTLTGS